MDDNTASFGAETSLLLWALGAAVAMLAMHVALGWIRRAQRRRGVRQQWPALALASMTLGTGLCAAALLSLQATALPFAMHFDGLESPVLWLASMLGCLPAARWQAGPRQSALALAGSGAALAVVAVGVQWGWMAAAGLRPGVVWHTAAALAAALLMCLGLTTGWWAARQGSAQATAKRRALWRGSAALLMSLSLLTGQEVLITGCNLLNQRSSDAAAALPGTVLGLVSGALVPLVLAMMAMDIALRSRRHGAEPAGFTPHKRSKRRHRVRQL